MNNVPCNIGKVLSAVNFAAVKHRDQRRKNKEASPYINHPIAVAELLWNIGHVRNIRVVLAALLHDTLEDTAATPEEISSLFGPEVLTIVQEVTDDKTLPKAQRKQLQIEHVPHLSIEAKQVKLADKICNVRDVLTAPPVTWTPERRRDYVDWAIYSTMQG